MPQLLASSVGLFLFQIGAPLAVVNAATAALAGTLGQIIIGGAVALGANALAARRATPALKPQDVQTEIKNEVGPRRVVVGEVRVAGASWWRRTVENDPDTAWIGGVFNHGRIAAYVQWRLDDVPVVIDGSGEILTSPYKDNGSDEVHFIFYRLGLATETKYSELLTYFEADEMRGDGLATALLKVNNWENAETQIQVFPNNVPTLTATIRGRVLFDPREPAHDRLDETTWEYSDNPAVFLLNYLFILADGFGIPWERVAGNLAEWEAAMDVCDEAVGLAAGGTEARYRCAFAYHLTDDPVDVASRALSTCDGRIWARRNGQIGIRVGRFAAPSVTIESRDILGAEITGGQDPLDAIEGVRASYMSADHGYKEQEAEAWPTAAAVAALAEERVLALDLTAVPSHGQARRLMKRAFVLGNAGWHGTLTTNLAGLRAIDERYIRVRLDALAIDTTFEVRSFSIEVAPPQVSMEISQVEETIDDWDPATEEGTAPPIPENRYFVPADEGTAIGDFTGNGGLAACYDGVTNSNASVCAKKSGGGGFDGHGYVGKTWDAPKAFSRAIIHGSNNQGFVENVNPAVTLTIYGKNGAAPASATDGTVLGTLAFTEGSNESAGRQIESTDTVSKWDHWWVDVHNATSADSLLCAEVRWWEQRPL